MRDRLRTLHTSSASFQFPPEMVSPLEGNKAGRDSTDGSVFAPSGTEFALVALIVGLPGGAMEADRHVTKFHRSGG